MRPHPTVAHPGHPKRRAALRAVGAAASIAASAWMVASCSLMYDLSTAQCSTDLDCTSRGGVFAELACVDGLCQEPLGACNSSADCNVEVSGVELRACVDRQCVNVLSPECPYLLPQTEERGRQALLSGNPLILGAFANTSSTFGNQLRNYDLALTEFDREMGGIKGTPAFRPLVMVVCNSVVEDPAAIDGAMTHLADTLKVPGVVSAMLPEDLQRAFLPKGFDAKMFFMSPLESDPNLAALPDQGLVWHVTPGGDTVGRAYRPLVTRTVEHLNITGPVKVATIVAPDIRFLGDLMETVRDRDFGVFVNGQPLRDNGVDTYLERSLTSVYTDENAPVTDQIDDLLAFQPHIIIAGSADEFLTKIVPALEDGWDEGQQPLPFYLLSPFHYNNPELAILLAAYPTVKTRLVGVNAPAAEDADLYEDYLSNLRNTHGPEALAGYENYYDATYYMIYAAAAAVSRGEAIESGEDLRDGMERLLDGVLPFNMGPQDLSAAIPTLDSGADITLMGTMGPPDFNEISGARSAVGSAWCVDATGTRPDVLRYQPGTSPAEATMSGTMESCIPGF